MLTFLKRYWPSLLIFLVICWLTLAPEPVGKVHVELFAGADKVVHGCMMAGLTAAMLFDRWRIDRQRLRFKPMLIISLIAIIFSAADEWAQEAMRMGRTGDPLDLLADITGIIVALLLTPPLLRRLPH